MVHVCVYALKISLPEGASARMQGLTMFAGSSHRSALRAPEVIELHEEVLSRSNEQTKTARPRPRLRGSVEEKKKTIMA